METQTVKQWYQQLGYIPGYTPPVSTSLAMQMETQTETLVVYPIDLQITKDEFETGAYNLGIIT